MLGRLGCYLTTERGGWNTLALTGLLCLATYWSMDMATLALSVEAIVVGLAVLSYQGDKECRDLARDKAMHAKLDELIRGVPDADDQVAGIEPDEA